ncbi:dihydrodipicolinate synthase family protein [Trinickia terrae]|uniref:Dihydrodipicolinate synthase family protein n=1 Tax=Trinickia terrae TaxID=2571161 RepID=A0A4U1HF83_9BURK|nr:dihydrodipicolinate synthase family protein [Trinickia terrae]TKC78077.1 dihydrodipicolinate synthase family protein [Trinickia terrae]
MTDLPNSGAVIEGIVPVMLTPFDEAGAIDYAGLERLIEWYLAHGSDALFAVAQSSEMQFLSLAERRALARFVVERVAGRVPVVASGHISADPDAQAEELNAAAESGAQGVVLVTNRLDPERKGTEAFLANLKRLLARLPADLPLGLYECPAPYRRLLSDDELKACIDTGRFVMLKDVSCDLPTVKRRVKLAEGSPLKILNANAAIAWDAMKAGSAGFNGVFTNFHPDLYQWLRTESATDPALAEELSTFLVVAAVSEALGYPALAKIYHQRIGTFASTRCRAIDYDVRERFWALDAVLDRIVAGTEHFRARIAARRAASAAARPGAPRRNT